MATEHLTVKMGLNSTQFSRGLDDAQSKTKAFKSNIDAMGKKLAAVFGGYAVVRTLQKWGMSAMQTAAGIRQVQEASDLSAETIQKFTHVALQNNASLEEAHMALRQFSVRIGKARQGTGEAAQALKAMGVALEDVNGVARTNDDLFGEVIDKLANMDDKAQRAANAMSILSESGARLAGALKQFNDDKQSGIIISDIELARLNMANASFQSLKDNVKQAATRGFAVFAELYSAESALGEYTRMTTERQAAQEAAAAASQKVAAEAKAATLAESQAIIDKARMRSRKALANDQTKYALLMREELDIRNELKDLEAGTVDHAKKVAELEGKQVEVAKQKQKIEEDAAKARAKTAQEDKRHAQDMINATAALKQAKMDVANQRQSIASAKSDISGWSLGELVSLYDNWQGGIMPASVADAKYASEAKAAALDARLWGNTEDAAFFTKRYLDTIAGIDALRESERYPMKAMTERLDELVRMSREEGLKMQAIMGK